MEELLRKIEDDLARAIRQKDEYYIKIFSGQIERVKALIESDKQIKNNGGKDDWIYCSI